MAELARKIVRIAKHVLWATIKSTLGKKTPISLPINFTSASSVLVIRPDRMGDVILSTPVYESIKKSFPHLQVNVLVNRVNVPVLADNPNIDKIIPFDTLRSDAWHYLSTLKIQALTLTLKQGFYFLRQFYFGAPENIISQLRRNRFDVVFTLNKKFSVLSSFLALISKAKYRVGYAHDETAWLYDARMPLDNQHLHESVNNLELISYVGITKIMPTPRLYFNGDEEKKIQGILRTLRKHPELPMITFKPGTRTADQAWKSENFRTVAEKLSNSGKAEVLFICGPGDEQLIDQLNEETNLKVGRLPLLPIKELALVI